jgi:hypothetical protein
MNRLLTRILLLDHVADERFQDHVRRSNSAAIFMAAAVAFALLEYHLLVEHRIPCDLISLIYAMGGTKIAFMLWYRIKN